MKKNVFIIAAALTLAACGQGNGYHAGEPQAAKIIDGAASTKVDIKGLDLKSIEISGSMDVYYTQDTSASVRIEGPSSHRKRIIISADTGRLIIKEKNDGKLFGKGSNKAKVYVTSPRLSAVKLNGSCDFVADRGIKADAFEATLSGSGNVRIGGLKASTLSTNIAGSGDIDIERIEVGSACMTVAGSGGMSAGSVKADRLEANVAGSGNVSLGKADIGTADCSISGSGNISIAGYVGSCERSVAGSGSINIK